MADIYRKQGDEYAETWDSSDNSQVMPAEKFWVDHYIWLKAQGYLLRPRYHPEWVPSWKGTNKLSLKFEDRATIPVFSGRILDAIRISDGKPVALKIVFKSEHPHEAEIMSYFSSELLVSDPMNHCIPIFDKLEVPNYNGDMFLLVMPFLRDCLDPYIETICELVEFLRQIFEGLQFMHKHHVAHRWGLIYHSKLCGLIFKSQRLHYTKHHDGSIADVPQVVSSGQNQSQSRVHRVPQKNTRTERPPKYLLVDFGLSRRYDPKDGPPRERAIRGGDKSVPEFQGNEYYKPSNPFPTDIYYLGNMIKEEFLDKAVFALDFISSLVADMLQEKPSRRPTIDEVVARFDAIYRSLSTSRLRLRFVKRTEEDPLRWWRNAVYFFRRVRHVLMRIPPVPRTTAYPPLNKVGLRPRPFKGQSI